MSSGPLRGSHRHLLRLLPRRTIHPPIFPPKTLTWGQRVRLSLEILQAYVELLPVLRRNDLRAMIETARTVRVPPEPIESGYDRYRAALRLGTIVQYLIKWLPSDKRCLINSLVAVRVLAHRDIESCLVIGVRAEDKGFEAHAWVEHQGRPVLPPGDFERLAEL